MIQTSSGYLAAVNSTSREWSARLASSGTAINAEIMSVTVHKGTRGDELNVGTMYAPYFEATVRNYSGASLLGSVLTFDLGLDVSGTIEWTTIATGTVISAKAQGVDLLLTLAGPISALGDQTIESTSTAVADVVAEIQTKLGTTVTCRDGITSLTGALSAAMTGQTIRGALQSLAAFFGGYVTEDATGQVVVGGLDQASTASITPDTYQEEPELSTGTYEITGWRVFANSETYYLDGTEPYLDTACQFMTQTQFNAVKAGVIGQIFRGGALDQTLGNPLIEPWDVLTLSVSADVMPRLGTVTIIYDGGVSVRIESPVTTDDEQPAQVVGPLSGQVAEATATADSAKTSAEEALDAAQEVNNHFYVDSAGLHVTLLESSPNTGQNILIDSYGLQVRDGETILAEYAATGIKIGQDGGTQMVIDNDSMETTDENGVAVLRLGYVDAAEATIELTMTPSTTPTEAVTLPLPVVPIWTGGFSVSLTAYSQEGTEEGVHLDTDHAGTYTMSRSFASWSVVLSNTEVTATCQSYAGSTTLAPKLTVRYNGTTAAPVFSVGVNDVEGAYSTAFGTGNEASGISSHAEGEETIASGNRSHAEGQYTQATGIEAHAEGFNTRATASSSHAEGSASRATGGDAHAEGNLTVASSFSAHAEGNSTTASGAYSHAQGTGTTANSLSQTALGEYNEVDTAGTSLTRGTYAVIVGNGTDDNNRSNAMTIDWNGNLAVGGHVSDGYGNVLGQGGGGGPTFDQIYPVGSIYMSVNNVDPGTLFGGSWQPIEDTFLLAAGTNHAAGSTGGEETVTLTAAQSGLPAHTHGFTQPTVNGGAENGAITGGTHGHTANYRSVYNGSSNYSAVTGSGGTATTTGAIVNTSGSHTHNLPAHTHSVSGGAVGAVTGGAKAASSAHNNMPPFLAVYVWQRTA